MSTLARLSTLLVLALFLTSCMSTHNSSYDEGADPYASIGYEDDALLGSVDLKSPVNIADGTEEELEFDMDEGTASRAPASAIAQSDDLELSLDDEEGDVTIADVEDALEEPEEEIAEMEIEEIPEPARRPASVVKLVPSGNTATIVYTPLWIKIPLGECLEVVQNRNYENGACIKRRL